MQTSHLASTLGAFVTLALIAAGTADSDAQEVAAADRTAALAAQYSRSAAAAGRQTALVEARLDATRQWRLRGGNANGSSFSLNFNGTAPEGATGEEQAAGNAAFNTANHIAAEKARRTERYGVWFGGNVVVDADRAANPRIATTYSDGVVIGTDARLSPRFLAGNAVGMAFDRVGVGADASQRSRFFSDTLYGTLFTSENSFLDTQAGVALTGFHNVYGAGVPSGSQATNRFFTSMRYSHVLKRDHFEFVPYGRATASYVMLGDYLAKTRSGGPVCSADAQEMLALTAGLRARTTLATAMGSVKPHAEVAMSRAHTSGYDATLVFASAAAQPQVIDVAASGSAGVSASAGVDWAINSRTSANAVYAISASRGAIEPKQTISAGFTLRF